MIINVSFHRGHIIQYLSTILSMTFLLFSVSIVASCKDLAWCIVQDGTNFYAILFIFMPINMSAGMLCFRSFLAHQRLSTRMPNSTTFNPHFARTPSEICAYTGIAKRAIHLSILILRGHLLKYIFNCVPGSKKRTFNPHFARTPSEICSPGRDQENYIALSILILRGHLLKFSHKDKYPP